MEMIINDQAFYTYICIVVENVVMSDQLFDFDGFIWNRLIKIAKYQIDYLIAICYLQFYTEINEKIKRWFQMF